MIIQQDGLVVIEFRNLIVSFSFAPWYMHYNNTSFYGFLPLRNLWHLILLLKYVTASHKILKQKGRHLEIYPPVALIVWLSHAVYSAIFSPYLAEREAIVAIP